MDRASFRAVAAPGPLLAALLGWGLTAALVANLLGGPFAERSCQTGCVQALGLAAFLSAVAGVLLGVRRRPRQPLDALVTLSLLGLIAIYLTTFLIGVLTG